MKPITTLLSLLLFFQIHAQSYQSAESVEYDQANNRWLVANGSNIIIDDGNGNLSFFGSGSASHGMEIMNNTLFAISSNVIKGYDLTSEEEVMSLTIPGVSFLNGMASDGINQLWVTDFGANKIYDIDVSDLNMPVATEIVSNTGGTPNGILFDEARLLFVTWGPNAAIKAVDLVTNAVTDVIANTGLGNIDGIVKTTSGEYIIASWTPARLTKYASDFSTDEIVESPNLSAPADIGISDTDVIGVPMGNEVIFVESTLASDTFEWQTGSITVSENPITASTFLIVDTEYAAMIEAQLYDISGKWIQEVLPYQSIVGVSQTPLLKKEVASGHYFLILQVDGKKFTKKLIVK